MSPAGFWQRYLAYSLDWLLLSPLVALLVLPSLGVAWSEGLALNARVQNWLLQQLLLSGDSGPSPWLLAQALQQDPTVLEPARAAVARIAAAFAVAGLKTALCAGLYFIAFEASPWSATPGKRLLGLRVLDSDGRPAGLGRASVRFLAGALSWLTFNLGHAMAGLRRDGRALHDLLAGTCVVAAAPLPRWGRWLLWAQLALLVGVLLGLLARVLYLLVQLAML